jgi:two-component sensor histidine kinase
MSELTERLRGLADAHERLEQGGGASEELREAADCIDELVAALGRIKSLTCGRQYACAQSNGKDICCKCIARQALGDEA